MSWQGSVSFTIDELKAAVAVAKAGGKPTAHQMAIVYFVRLWWEQELKGAN